MKRSINFIMIVTILYSLSCRSQTSTPREFISSFRVSKVQYKADSLLFVDEIMNYYNFMNRVVKPNQIADIQNVYIDSIFYGDSHKIACMVLLTKKSRYAESGIQYSGECYIAYKNEKIDSLYKLKYDASSVQSIEDVSVLIRNIYFQELNYIEGENNINDKRFWDNHNWNDAISAREKLRDFEDTKRSHPENVYPNNQ